MHSGSFAREGPPAFVCSVDKGQCDKKSWSLPGVTCRRWEHDSGDSSVQVILSFIDGTPTPVFFSGRVICEAAQKCLSMKPISVLTRIYITFAGKQLDVGER